MELGQKIKELRQRRKITQEALAEAVGVTAQAVSKWECGQTLPDVALLPELAVYFGVTVDELFALPEDQELERIQNMIWDERLILPERFEQADSDNRDTLSELNNALRGNIPAAIATYEEELTIFETEWGFTTGETADKIRREIDRLKKKL